MDEQRRERLLADLALVNQLRQSSTILQFKSAGDPPSRYTITFRGGGVCRTGSKASVKGVDLIQVHRIEIRLPYTYPTCSPDIHWLTPVFHPNVAGNGLLSPEDLGLDWDQEMGLDVVCERLWDAARMSYLDLPSAVNLQARDWLQGEPQISFPVDQRPLRDKRPGTSSNVIKYTRRAGSKESRPGRNTDVMFIGEDTPTPRIPTRVRIETPQNDDDIFYIGDD